MFVIPCEPKTGATAVTNDYVIAAWRCKRDGPNQLANTTIVLRPSLNVFRQLHTIDMKWQDDFVTDAGPR